MPDKVEAAPSGRARCRACNEKVGKGELRFGEAAPNPYGEGETHHWFHLACAADRRPEKVLPLLEDESVDVAERASLIEIAKAGVDNPKLERVGKAERAPSGRARCRHCRQLVDKGALRVKVEVFEEGMMNPLGFVHARCSSYRFGQAGLVARLRRWSPELSDDDFAEFEKELLEGAENDPKSAVEEPEP